MSPILPPVSLISGVPYPPAGVPPLSQVCGLGGRHLRPQGAQQHRVEPMRVPNAGRTGLPSAADSCECLDGRDQMIINHAITSM